MKKYGKSHFFLGRINENVYICNAFDKNSIRKDVSFLCCGSTNNRTFDMEIETTEK